MYILRSWLADYIDFADLSAEDFSELISTRVAEVDETLLTSDVSQATVVKVVSIAEHPNKPKLKIATVDDGSSQRQIVCGAGNCREGMLTAMLAPGAALKTADGASQAVKKTEIAGIESNGVLVSERELGLSQEHNGIIDFSESFLAGVTPSASIQSELSLGSSLTSIFGEADVILEIDNKSLTHRPDLWCHYGFARELSAILSRPLLRDLDAQMGDSESAEKLLAAFVTDTTKWTIEVDADCGCRRFMAVELSGVKAEQSPFWLRHRLHAVGAGVRNKIVDLSNYVMLDVGQPNHTYDADKLPENKLHIRLANDDESFAGLNETDYTVSSQDVVVSSGSQAVALGGVLGGASSAVSEQTNSILFEAANWDPVRIRKTSVRLDARTDASNRFEKSLSATNVPLGVWRYYELATAFFPGLEVSASLVDTFPVTPEEVFVDVGNDYLRERLGTDVDDARIDGILERLGFQLEIVKGSSSRRIKVPYYRATRDISIEEDFVEEVGRTLGYENIPESAPLISSEASQLTSLQRLEYEARDVLQGCGFSETYLYSAFSGEWASSLGYPLEDAITLLNPVDTEQQTIRTSLIPGLLQSANENAKHQKSVALFELGRSYHRCDASEGTYSGLGVVEDRILGLAFTSGMSEKQQASVLQPPVPSGADFYQVLAVLRRVLSVRSAQTLLPKELTSESAAYFGWMHPYRSAELRLGDISIGILSEVRPSLSDYKGSLILAEISLRKLLEAVKLDDRSFKETSKYPSSLFEMSLVSEEQTPFSEISALIESVVPDDKFLGVEVLDVYRGEPLESNQKSTSVKLAFGAGDRTLSGEEVETLQQSLISAVAESKFSLRS